MNGRGFTLTEIIVFIVVAAILVPTAHLVFSTALRGSADPERIMTARYLAEQKMEELTKNRFADVVTESVGYQTVTGNPNYQWKWTVGYIELDDKYPPNLTLKNSASPTKYKKIIVWVNEPQGYEYKVYTIITDRA